MKVGIFYNSISNPKKFSNKTMLMDNFKEGVVKHGDTAISYTEKTLSIDNIDCGFVLGYTLENNFRRKIIDTLSAKNIPAVFVDSNILHYARPEHEWHRYSIGSVYPDSGVYFFAEFNNKWSEFSRWHNVGLKPWRKDGNHILILCQRPHGWNMFGIDHMSWLITTIKKIKHHCPERPVHIRFHPGDGTRQKQILEIKNVFGNLVTISEHGNITEDLKNCWCAIGYNSTPTTVAAIEGIPVYVEDPLHSWASDIAFNDLSLVNDPPMPDRSNWVERIANIHWSNQEVKRGQLWAAIKQHISRTQK